MDHEKEVVDFDQLVRIFVDTDVDTHFIVSLPRTSTVAELRGLVKATHRHCYPDSGDVEIGKLAVPGGDYGYHLADFLLIGQVYDRYEGKVFAEVKDHDPTSNSSQGLFRMPTLSLKISSTPKKVSSFAPQPFENGGGEVSGNGSEPGNLLAAVGFNACELVVPKLQKEEIDEDGNCVLGSQGPLDGLPKRCFERIDEEEDKKLVELPDPEVSLLPDMSVRVDEITTHALSTDIRGDTRKRSASECNERPSKSRRLTEPAPPSGNTSKAPSEDATVWNAAASLSCANRSDDLDADHSSPSGSKRRKKKVSHSCDLTVSEGVTHEVEDKEEMRDEEKKETVLVIGSGEEGNGNGGVGVGKEEEEEEEEALFLLEDPNVLAALASLGKKKRKLKKLRTVKELELEKEVKAQEVLTEKKEKNGEKQKQKEPEQEMDQEEPEEVEEMLEKKEKKGKKEKRSKQREPEQEMEPDAEKKPEEVGEMMVKKEKKIKKENERTKRKPKNLKQNESHQEKEPKDEEVPEDGQVLGEEKDEMTERKDKKAKKQKQKEPEQEMDQEEPEEVEEMMEKKEKKNKTNKKNKKEKKEKEKKERKHKSQDKKQREQEKEKEQEKEELKEERIEQEKVKLEEERIEQEKVELEEERIGQENEELEKERIEQEKEKLGKERVEKEAERLKEGNMQEQLIEEITPLDCASLNPLLEVSEGKPQQEDNQVGAAAVSAGLSDHAVNDEEDSDDDVPGSEAKKGRTVSDQDSGRKSCLRDEVSESGTPQREAQVSRDTSEEGTTLHGGMVKVLTPKTNLFGDVNDMEITSSYQGGSDPSPETQGTKTGSVKSQESPNPSKHLSYTGAGRGAPSQTRSIESSRDMMKGMQTGGRNSKANESQSSQCSEKFTQQSEGINLDSEVSGAWLRRGLLDSEPGRIDQSQVAKPAHSRSRSGESSAESDPRSADQTEVSRKDDHVPEASQINHAVKSPEKHASTSAKRSDGGEVYIKNDSLEFFSQDQSYHVAPTQVQKAISGSTTEESSDESDDEDTDNLKKQTAGNLSTGGESEESSDESGDLTTPVRPSFPSLTTGTSLPTVSRMTGNGGSQSFKRRASGVAAEIEAKFAQFIESQGGLDEIMGITLGQRKRSMPVESSTQGAGSLAMPFGSPLDIALNTQESVKTSPIALDVAQASQGSAEKHVTSQFKVPKPVLVGTTSGAVRDVLKSAAKTAPLSGREAPKARAVKELRLKRKESTPSVDKSKQSGGLLSKNSNVGPLPALEPSKEERKVRDSRLSTPPRTSKATVPDALNANESYLLKSSEKKKRREEKLQDSQFMIVNNTDHISEQEQEEKQKWSEEDGSLTSSKEELKMVETGVVGSQEMFVLDSSGKKKKRKISEKEGSRKKRMKFLPEDLDGKEVTVLPENSVERSARETEELYMKLEKANRDLWLQNNSVSSFRKDEEKVGSRAADFDDTEGGEDDVAQSRLIPEEPEVDEPVNEKLKTTGPPPSPVLCAGTTEASDREDSAFQSQDEKAETSQQDKFKITDVFDYVSDDELPTKVLSMKKAGTNEKKKAKRMEEVSGKAVQRVLEDEMLHVADASDAPGKNSRKAAKPIKWAVRVRSLSPGGLATSPHGGTIPSSAAAAEFRSKPKVVSAKLVEDVAASKARSATKTPRGPKPKREDLYDESGAILCPMGCGKPYSKKTSAFYLHQRACTGAPL